MYKDVESQGGKSDSNIASGTVIGTHGSAARLVTVEHNGKPLPSTFMAFKQDNFLMSRRLGRNSSAPQESTPADPAFSAEVILLSRTARARRVS